jgi:hypothetical protein
MSRRIALAFFAMTLIGGLDAHAQEPKAEPPKAKAEDVKSADAIVAALYDVISGDKGQERDWDRFKSLFVPEARLIPVVRTKHATLTRTFTVDEFAKMAGESSRQQGFFETEIARKSEKFGAVTHVFSTYESKREKDGKPFDRGMNSIQLLNDGTRWWVVTIYWDRETPSTPIPAEYLPKT